MAAPMQTISNRAILVSVDMTTILVARMGPVTTDPDNGRCLSTPLDKKSLRYITWRDIPQDWIEVWGPGESKWKAADETEIERLIALNGSRKAEEHAYQVAEMRREREVQYILDNFNAAEPADFNDY